VRAVLVATPLLMLPGAGHFIHWIGGISATAESAGFVSLPLLTCCSQHTIAAHTHTHTHGDDTHTRRHTTCAQHAAIIHCIWHLCSRSESIKAGHSIVVIPGGLAEAILSSPTEPAILLKARYPKT
jgi:hypothetical protein